MHLRPHDLSKVEPVVACVVGAPGAALEGRECAGEGGCEVVATEPPGGFDAVLRLTAEVARNLDLGAAQDVDGERYAGEVTRGPRGAGHGHQDERRVEGDRREGV